MNVYFFGWIVVTLQAIGVFYCVRQLTFPYRFPRWTRAWSYLLTSVSLMAIRRATVLSFHLVGKPIPSWVNIDDQIIFPFLITFFLLCGLRDLSMIFSHSHALSGKEEKE